MHGSLHPLHQRIVDINEAASLAYVNAESARRRYWAKHATFLAAVQCMDGRVLLPAITDTPIGLIKPFRAMGGRFEAFWPSFLGRVRAWVDDAVRHGSPAAILLSYHYSASAPHLGCAGWRYDTRAARSHAERLREDLTHVFADALWPVVIGIETDRGLMTFHGRGGDVDGESVASGTLDGSAAMVRAMPDVPAEVRRDLLPLLEGNARHCSTSSSVAGRNAARLGHDERILAIGQGFDWLAKENLALIVNDADPGLADSIRVAADILEQNLARREGGDAATILSSVPYRDPGIDRRQAEIRSRGLLRFCEGVIADANPTLWRSGRLSSLAAVVWSPARRLELLPADRD